MTWNPAEEEETTNGNLIDKGSYLCLVSDASVHQGATINHRGIKVTLQIVNPRPGIETKFDGRKVYLYFTWDNPNATAVQIGKKKLADLLFAVDVIRAFNTPDDVCNVILDKEVLCNVFPRKRTDTGETNNDVSMFFRPDGTHRGSKQSFKLDPWGGVSDEAVSARGHASVSAGEDDVPF